MSDFISVNRIFSDIVKRVSEKYGGNVSYQFGDWEYISNQLVIWGKSPMTSPLKYPIICLISPFEENRSEEGDRVSLWFIILVNTRKDYLNEDREKCSFENVLRPIYRIFIDEITHDGRFVSNYRGIIPHIYIENYRYGRVGVLGPDGKPFRDFIDAIEIKDLELTIKKIDCDGKKVQRLPRNGKL